MARLLSMAFLLLLVCPLRSHAHEIPKRVTVQAFVRPDGRLLRVLVRAPLESMRDVEWTLRGPGYLNVAASDSMLHDAARLWIAGGLVVMENGIRLAEGRVAAARASLPSDRAFDTFESAYRMLRSPALDGSVDLPWQQAMLDVLLEYDIRADTSQFAIDPSFARLGVQTNTVVRFLPPNGAERVYAYTGDPGLLDLDPGPLQAAWRFVRLGFEHILDGTDHLLFLLCLVIPFRSARPLIALVSSFTVAHSITLFSSALGLAPTTLWFPPLVEWVIALSIVYMACENMLGSTLNRRWIMTFAFGLVHGFGFSFALRDSLQFAGSHLVASLAAFNIGVELGQLAVLLVGLPALVLLFRRIPERAGTVLLSAFVAHTAWHWTMERWDLLSQYRVAAPTVDRLFVADVLRAAMIALIVGGAGWLLHTLLGRFIAKPVRASRILAVAAIGSAVGAALLVPRGVMAQGPHRKAGAATPPARQSPKLSRTTKTTMAGVYTAEQAQQGKEVFAGTCTGCHTPASHTGVLFTSKWVGRSVDDLFMFIRNSMPKIAPGSLSDDEYLWVTTYLLKLNGMPAGATELSQESSQLRTVRIDTVRTKAK